MLVWMYRILAALNGLATILAAGFAIYFNDFIVLVMFFLLICSTYLLILKAQEE